MIDRRVRDAVVGSLALAWATLSAAASLAACRPDSVACAAESFVYVAAGEPSAPPTVEPLQVAVTGGRPFGEFVRSDNLALIRAIDAGTRGLTNGPVDNLRDAAERVRSDVLPFNDREIYALLAAALVAVLSLSRRRSL